MIVDGDLFYYLDLFYDLLAGHYWDKFLDDLGHGYYALDYFLDWDYFLYVAYYLDWFLDHMVLYSLALHILYLRHNLLHNPINRYNLRYFPHNLHNLLHNLLHFDQSFDNPLNGYDLLLDHILDNFGFQGDDSLGAFDLDYLDSILWDTHYTLDLTDCGDLGDGLVGVLLDSGF